MAVSGWNNEESCNKRQAGIYISLCPYAVFTHMLREAPIVVFREIHNLGFKKTNIIWTNVQGALLC